MGFEQIDKKEVGIVIASHKVCRLCLKPLSIDNYYIAHGTKDGYRSECKYCLKQNNKEWREKNKESIRQQKALYRALHKEQKKIYDVEHKERKRERSYAYYHSDPDRYKSKNSLSYYRNREKRLAYAKEYAEKNKDKILEYKISYRKAFSDHIKQHAYEYYKKIKENNPNLLSERRKKYRIASILKDPESVRKMDARKYRKWRLSHQEIYKTNKRNSYRRAIIDLRDIYIKKLLKGSHDIHDYEPWLIEIKRQQVALCRHLKNNKMEG